MLWKLTKRVFTRKNASIIIVLATFFVIYVLYFSSSNSKKAPQESVQYLKDLDHNISCYQSEEKDKLYSADYSSFPVTDKLIFFHETSCKGGLDSRQACSIESAARSNPDWKIYVLFAGHVPSSATFETLLQFSNVQVKRVHLLEYSQGTPMEKVFAMNYLKNSSYPVHHAMDAMRLLSLYKHGGMHMDLDVIVMRSFNNLSKNFFAKQQDRSYPEGTPIGAGIIRLSTDRTGRKFSEATVAEFVNNYNPLAWDANGPGLLSRVLRNLCSEKNEYEMTAETCHGLEIYPHLIFYPVDYRNSTTLFLKGDLMFVKDTLAIHMWNKLTQKYHDLKDTVYEKLAQRYCPSIHKLYGRDFGW